MRQDLQGFKGRRCLQPYGNPVALPEPLRNAKLRCGESPLSTCVFLWATPATGGGGWLAAKVLPATPGQVCTGFPMCLGRRSHFFLG